MIKQYKCLWCKKTSLLYFRTGKLIFCSGFCAQCYYFDKGRCVDKKDVEQRVKEIENENTS